MIKHILIWGISIGLFILGMFILHEISDSEHGGEYFALIRNAGIFSFIIIVCGIAGIIYGIADILKFRSGNIAPIKTIAELEPLITGNQYDKALELCQNTRNPLILVLKQGLDKKDKGKDAIINAMDISLQETTFRINSKPEKYLLFGILALLIGVSGAVSSMIHTINSLYYTWWEARDIARGFEQTLVSMAIGVTVSMLNIFFYFLLRIRLNYYVFKLGSISRKLSKLFK